MWSKQFAWNNNSVGRVQKGTRTSRCVDTRKVNEQQTEEDEPHYETVEEILGQQGIMTFTKTNI